MKFYVDTDYLWLWINLNSFLFICWFRYLWHLLKNFTTINIKCYFLQSNYLSPYSITKVNVKAWSSDLSQMIAANANVHDQMQTQDFSACSDEETTLINFRESFWSLEIILLKIMLMDLLCIVERAWDEVWNCYFILNSVSYNKVIVS